MFYIFSIGDHWLEIWAINRFDAYQQAIKIIQDKGQSIAPIFFSTSKKPAERNYNV